MFCFCIMPSALLSAPTRQPIQKRARSFPGAFVAGRPCKGACGPAPKSINWPVPFLKGTLPAMSGAKPRPPPAPGTIKRHDGGASVRLRKARMTCADEDGFRSQSSSYRKKMRPAAFAAKAGRPAKEVVWPIWRCDPLPGHVVRAKAHPIFNNGFRRVITTASKGCT